MHNHYAYLYNQVVYQMLQNTLGKGEAVLFARSASVGAQQFPVHWGGDCYATYESMAESLRGGLSLGMSGFGFWSHDIGGFENTAPAHVYKRWCAFGLLSSHSRLHGSKSYRVPWVYDDEACDVLRYFTQWKCQLMPYLFDMATQAAKTGAPMMRAMMLEFPDDPGCDYLDRQYMLGDSLLVAPVFSEHGDVSVYLPHGRWTHLLSNQEAPGGWRQEQHGFTSLPLYVRPNTLLALGANDQKPDYDYLVSPVFHLFALEDGAEAICRVPSLAGETRFTLTVTRRGDTLQVTPQGAATGWTLCLRNIVGTQIVDDGVAAAHPLGTLITPKDDSHGLIIRL